ncbi:MAG: hypothetical protein ABIO46_11470 [Chitinophagales bacterium]
MPREKLFHLIHSLSPIEKKFFKQYAHRHIFETETIYLQLFDAITKQSTYDEEKLKKQLQPASFNKNFHKAKGYLYSQILKSLVIRKSKTSSFSHALELLSTVEILCEKQLFFNAQEQLEQVKIICEENEFQELALTAIRWEEAIAASSQLMNPGTDIMLADNYSKRKELLGEISLTVEYRYLFFQWSLINAPFTPQAPDADKKLAILFNNQLLKPENFPAAKAPRRFYLGLNAMKARLKGEHDRALELTTQIVQIMESYPRDFYYTEVLVIYTYYSIVMDAVAAVKFSIAERYLAKLKQLQPQSPQIRYNHFHLMLATELTVFKAMNQRTECLAAIDAYEKSLRYYKSGISRIHEFKNYLLIMNWLVKEKKFEKAITFINMMLDEKVTEKRILPFQYHARLLTMLVHFELKNLSFLEHLVRQTGYYFSRYPLNLSFPTILLQFFRNTLKPKVVLKNELELLEKKLAAVKDQPQEKNAFNSFLECGWLQNMGIFK